MAPTKRQTSKETLAARRDFFMENGDSLVEIDRTEGFEASRGVLSALIRKGVGDRELVQQIAPCANQEELFVCLVKRRRGTKGWWLFVETVLMLPPETWEKGGGDLGEDLVRHLVSHDLLARIAHPRTKAHIQIHLAITTKAHPLYQVLDFSPYWLKAMHGFIEGDGAKRKGGDFKRAWDMVREAHRGFFIADSEPADMQEQELPDEAFQALLKYRCSRAKKDVLISMVNECFAAMVERGKLKPLEDTDYHATSDGHYQTVWKGPRGNKHRENVYIEHLYPFKTLILAVGESYAVTRRGGYRVRRTVRNQGGVSYRFTETSAKANKIVKYFEARKQARRDSRKPSSGQSAFA